MLIFGKNMDWPLELAFLVDFCYSFVSTNHKRDSLGEWS